MALKKKDEEKKEKGIPGPESIEELRASNELLSLFMRHSPVYAYIKEVTSTESRLVQASDNYQSMLGSSNLDIVGKTMEELFPPSLAAKITADDWAVVANGNVLQVEKDLDDRSYISVKFPFVQGDKNMLAGYMFDITDHKQAGGKLQAVEMKLLEGEDKLRKVDNKLRAGEDKLREDEEKLKEAEDKLRGVEGKLRGDKEKLKEAEGKLQEVEDKLRGDEEKLKEAEGKLREVEDKLRGGEGKLQANEGVLQSGKDKLREVEDRLQKEKETLRSAEEKLRKDKEELQAGKDKLQGVEDRLQKERETLRSAEEKLRKDKEALRSAEEKLRKDKEELQASGALRASLEEKESLLREVNHQAKNNLDAVIMLLEMQQKTKGSLLGHQGLTAAALTTLENRIKPMALVHEQLYQSQNSSQIDSQDYLNTLVSQLRTSLNVPSEIACSVNAAGVALKPETAVPVGMIVNELVTNAFKYAFPKNQPCYGADKCEVMISLEQKDTGYTLIVDDNGIGLPKGFNSKSTTGLQLAKTLGVEQLGGKLTLNRTHGTRFVLKFNVKQ